MWAFVLSAIRAVLLGAGLLDVVFGALALCQLEAVGFALLFLGAMEVYIAFHAPWFVVALFAWNSVRTHWKIVYDALKRNIH